MASRPLTFTVLVLQKELASHMELESLTQDLEQLRQKSGQELHQQGKETPSPLACVAISRSPDLNSVTLKTKQKIIVLPLLI